MEIVKTEGIVIGETNYSESSKILKVLTKDYGLISIMSKGCRNLKSKLRVVNSKLVYATFHFNYKENGISTLIGGFIPFLNIKNKERVILISLAFAAGIMVAISILDLLPESFKTAL